MLNNTNSSLPQTRIVKKAKTGKREYIVTTKDSRVPKLVYPPDKGEGKESVESPK